MALLTSPNHRNNTSTSHTMEFPIHNNNDNSSHPIIEPRSIGNPSPPPDDHCEDLRRRRRNELLERSLEEESLQERDHLIIRSKQHQLLLEEEEEEEEESDLMARLALGVEVDVVRAVLVSLLEEEQESRNVKVLDDILRLVRSLRALFVSICDRITIVDDDDDDDEGGRPAGEAGVGGGSDVGVEEVLWEMRRVHEVGFDVGSTVRKWEERWRRERKELEDAVSSLQEEKRDLGALLKAVMLENEELEKQKKKNKSLDRADGGERGWWLQKVGLGFITMGASHVADGSPSDCSSSSSNSSTKSDDSQGGEARISLASTFENITKNLRQEVTHLRRSLDESRSECHHLQILSYNQSRDIDRTKMYIKDLEERECWLTQKIEDLNLGIKEVEEEALRWREACEKEVEAGQIAIEEYERQITNLKEELKRANIELDTANRKIVLKEKLAAAAMAAQAAAEVSLRMADSRSVRLRQQIEELTGQLEEEGRHNHRGCGLQRVRHFCWPWRSFNVIPVATISGRSSSSVKSPEMLALLQ